MESTYQLRVTFKNMDHSQAIEDTATKKLEKLDKFLNSEPTPTFVDLVLEAQKTHAHHFVELRIKSPSYRLVAHDEGPDMYLVIESVVDKMSSELRKAKDKRTNHIHQKGPHRPG